MAVYLPRKVALNWDEYDVRFSIELMRCFVQGVEELVTDSILKYQTKKSEEHQGLDEDTFVLRHLFEEHFPNLHRRSALLTVWSLLEHELDKLCALYKSEKDFGLALSDFGGTGIDRSAAYLEKIAGLEGLKASTQFEYLKKVKRIRNEIAHEDGKLKDGITGDMKKLGLLSGDNEIVVEKGFLSELVDACDRYFKLIAASINAKEKPTSAEQ